MGERQAYALGSEQPEIARLDAQAALTSEPTLHLLRSAGIGPEMRVLDLGTGLGHVAQLVADLVGPEGEVVGVDADPALLDVAKARCRDAGRGNVHFVEADVRDYRDDGPFDAIVGRLILFHLEDPAAVVRHHAAALKPGGLVVAVDFDIGACRTEPPATLARTALEFLLSAFRGVGANPVIGVQLVSILRAAGLADVASYGIQVYLLPGDRRASLLLAGIVRTLAAATGGAGLPPELEPLESLEVRLADELLAGGAVLLPPTLVGAWGRA